MKRSKEAHTQNVDRGTGDYYGMGVKQRICRARGLYLYPPLPSRKRKGKSKTPVV